MVFVAAASFVNATVKIACIGDSITEGALSSDPYFYSYPAQLQEMLWDPTKFVVRNFGLAGTYVQKRLPLSNQYIESKAYD